MGLSLRIAVMTLLPLAGCAYPAGPWAFHGQLEGSDQVVMVLSQRESLKGFTYLTVVMPDDRRYWTGYPLTYLLRPGEAAPEQQEIPTGTGPGHFRRTPLWRLVANVTMNATPSPRTPGMRPPPMACEFHYLGPPDGTSQNGLGRCETEIGEVVTIRW